MLMTKSNHVTVALSDYEGPGLGNFHPGPQTAGGSLLGPSDC